MALTYITRCYEVKLPFGVGFFEHSTEFSIIVLTKDHVVIFTSVDYSVIYNGMNSNNGHYLSLKLLNSIIMKPHFVTAKDTNNWIFL